MSDSQKYEERRGTGHQNHCCLGLICWQLNKNFMLNVFYLWLLLHSTEEFQRAVRISTGQTLDPYVVHTVFQLFDKDGEIFIFVLRAGETRFTTFHPPRITNTSCITTFLCSPWELKIKPFLDWGASLPRPALLIYTNNSPLFHAQHTYRLHS